MQTDSEALEIAQQVSMAYYVLDLEYGATREEVEQSYRDLIRVWHPDKHPANSRLWEWANEKCKLINTSRKNLLIYLDLPPRMRQRIDAAREQYQGAATQTTPDTCYSGDNSQQCSQWQADLGRAWNGFKQDARKHWNEAQTAAEDQERKKAEDRAAGRAWTPVLTLLSERKTVIVNGHRIEIQESSPTHTKKVFYDGREVSSIWALYKGAVHNFRVVEDGQFVEYQVTTDSRWHGYTQWSELKRNGIVICTDR